MRVLIIGDIHGRHLALVRCLRQAVADFRIGAAIQVGDFGFYKDLLAIARERRLRFPVPLHVIDGNHEDHTWLHRALLAGADRVWKDELNLIYQPRASVEIFGASKVGFLGGALHADRPQQRNGSDGFPNFILVRDRERAVTLFNRQQPELIITHSCPSRIGVGIAGPAEMQPWVTMFITGAGFDAGPQDDCGEIELYHLWQHLEYRPQAWVFGHFHRFHQAVIAGTRFIGTDCDLESPSRTLVIWDTEERRLLLCPADPSGGG